MASNSENTPTTVGTALPQDTEKPTDKAAEKAAPAETEVTAAFVGRGLAGSDYSVIPAQLTSTEGRR